MISEVISKRGISQVVHFTTNHGLIGIIQLNSLKARGLLSEEQSLEYILRMNSSYRTDVSWVNHVSLSITSINKEFFSYCKNWHRDIFWCALCFSPEILEHEGVIFTTTNNIYPSVVRAKGVAGLEGMFAPEVVGRYGYVTKRSTEYPSNITTDIQAEVLYPNEVDLKYLQRVLVSKEDDLDDVYGIMSALDFSSVPVELCKEAFV